MNFDEVMTELRTEYLKTFAEKAATIKHNQSMNQTDLLELEFHKMKGTGATYGVPEISVLGKKMEDCCANSPQLLADTIPIVCELIEMIVEAYSNKIEFKMTETIHYQELIQKFNNAPV